VQGRRTGGAWHRRIDRCRLECVCTGIRTARAHALACRRPARAHALASRRPAVHTQSWLSGLAIRIAIDRGGVSEVEGGACATSATILASCRSAGLSAITRAEGSKDGHVIGKSQSLSVLRAAGRVRPCGRTRLAPAVTGAAERRVRLARRFRTQYLFLAKNRRVTGESQSSRPTQMEAGGARTKRLGAMRWRLPGAGLDAGDGWCEG
jgi:hypothetical protein